ncbi:VCBS repeat-containing protein [uncultured Algoriphagus sp.]|uniref:VCBS repeat-containing protein n=1 Tax=uncultured Algoriphagus sp. TaxID=417365 RepID=UPI0030EB5927|tara:strand:- start:63507 stop:66791 length:3285 start_codon:yes stop_codon:yes gene_type:complete
MNLRLVLLLVLSILSSCSKKKDVEHPLFELLAASETGINFRNDLSYTEKINPYTFRNFYNGAGVALADINQDGLIDIFFSGNQTSNKLYLNQGSMKFKDITQSAGLESEDIWSTGVSIADVNGDGLPDIYVCKSGPLGGQKRHNELFINNGDLTFSEKAQEYGLAEIGLSQHAVFFDFDKDGDLDLYLLSNSPRSVGIYDLREGQREIRDKEGGNKLFRNDGHSFTDISQQAGIYGSSIGYGLGVTVADVNKDSWPDLYVSNDFFERDYLYINNQNGTFTEMLPSLIAETSLGSMGADIADLDNDLYPDIFVTEMLPSELSRIKTKTPLEDWDKHQANIKSGYHSQFTRNTLQRNLGVDSETGLPIFIDVARQAGVEATDWSWGALIFDTDNDGLKDIFVANGIVKDLTDFDFVDFYVNNQEKIAVNRRDSTLLTEMIDQFPSNPQQNYLFKNLGNWEFKNTSDLFGLTQLSFSTGSAYGDLDNDGDLDLVVNNLNDLAFIYKNNTSELGLGNYIQLDLGQNFGAQITCYVGSQTYYQEFQPSKGYMSSVDPKIHFGLGNSSKVDSIQIIWPNEQSTILKNIKANQLIAPIPDRNTSKTTLEISDNTIFKRSDVSIPFVHSESKFVDFDRDRLRFWMISNEGPKVAKADINKDEREDIFIPGAKGQASAILTQNVKGDFNILNSPILAQDSLAEDILGVFFDANGDGFKDLMVGSGSIEFADNASYYRDRLYFNDGVGNFSKSNNIFSSKPTSFILAEDFDKDGDKDLIIGYRSVPFAYGIPTGLEIWKNDGKGNFSNITNSFNPELNSLGMLTDGQWVDLNQDGNMELIISGEWMPIRIFSFVDNDFRETSEQFGVQNTSGLWNKLMVEDVTRDGLPDIFGGNIGLNTRLYTTQESPLQLIINDFDQNGSIEQILVSSKDGKSIPWLMRNTLLKQLPALRKQLSTYESYANKSIEELFPPSVLSKSITLSLDILASTLWINDGKGKFIKATLPQEIQSAPIYAIQKETSEDGKTLIILGGNQSRIKPELGSQMGSYGWVLNQETNGEWRVLFPDKSGLKVDGEIRSILPITIKNKKQLVLFRSNDKAIVYEMH